MGGADVPGDLGCIEGPAVECDLVDLPLEAGDSVAPGEPVIPDVVVDPVVWVQADPIDVLESDLVATINEDDGRWRCDPTGPPAC